jgi:hypothetical protein
MPFSIKANNNPCPVTMPIIISHRSLCKAVGLMNDNSTGTRDANDYCVKIHNPSLHRCVDTGASSVSTFITKEEAGLYAGLFLVTTERV